MSAGGDGCGVVLLSSLVVGCDGSVVGDGSFDMNSCFRCLGFNQGNGCSDIMLGVYRNREWLQQLQLGLIFPVSEPLHSGPLRGLI